jgi:hypothetical protein
MKQSCLVLVAALIALAVPAQAANLSFGGDLKFHLFDMSSGSSWFIDTAATATPHDTTDRWDMGFERAYLYFLAQITDQVSVDIEPEIEAQSGATPELGMKIGSQRLANDRRLAIGLNAAKIAVALPWELQVSAGVLRPIFTEDYGEQKGFQESNRYDKTGANHWLGAWHDMGVELYRPFELQFGDKYLSIPTYLYLLNGTPDYLDIPASDNNNNKMVLLHAAPEFWKLRLIGSFGYGKWDDAGQHNVMRYAAGLGAEFGPVWLRAEYMGGRWDGEEFIRSYDPMVVDTFAARPFGYYAKLGLNIIPEKLRLIINYDYAEHNFAGFLSIGDPTARQQYTTISGTLGWSVVSGSYLLLGVEKALWQSVDDAGSVATKLDFWRPTLGWRTVF